MKIKTTSRQITNRLGDVETSTFSIKANAKAFRTLLDGLYSNKIRAVVREICSNGYDSHIQAGMDSIPIDVHLPNRFDPTFKVRDYGVSMTHEQIMGLYTTLFDSTKDETNELVGALGLGSKSPFAYTDSFSVIARLDGEKRTYVATLGDDGAPTISLVSRESSDEAQGIEVIIAVNADDFREFEEEMKALSVGFDPAPMVDGTELHSIEPKYVAEDGSFAVFRQYDIPSANLLAVRQGCVIYPVHGWEYERAVREFVAYGSTLVINVPIGDVSITASRESLSMDDATQERVHRGILEAREHVTEVLQKRLDACANRLEAMTLWYGANNANGDAIRNTFTLMPTWKGEPLKQYVNLNEKAGPKWESIKMRVRNQRDNVVFSQLDFTRRSNYRFIIKRSDEKILRGASRYREFVANHSTTDVYLWTDPTPKQLERLIRLTGIDPKTQIIPLSSLPDPGPPTRDGKNRSGNLSGVYHATGSYWYSHIEELPNDFVWISSDRVSRSEANRAWDARHKASLLGICRKDATLLIFTPGAVKRYKPSTPSLETQVVEMVNKSKDEVLAWLKDKEYNRALRQRGLEAYFTLRQPMLVNVTPTQAEYISNFLTWNEREEAEAEGIAEAKALLKNYPLLENPLDTDAIRWYIEARNKERNNP